MAYTQAHELFNNPNATVEELLDAFENLAIDFGHIAAMGAQGIYENPESDLVRTLF